MTDVDGILHDPVSGKTPQVGVAPSGADLHVRGGGIDKRIPISLVSASGGGWDGRSLHLTWTEGGEAWALTFDPAAARTLAGLLTEPLAAEVAGLVEKSRRTERRGRLTVPSIVFVFVFLPLVALLSLYLMRDRIIDAALRRLPVTVDGEVGNLVHTQLKSSKTLVADGPAVEAVRAIGSRLVAAAPAHSFSFRFEVVQDASVNAYAAPGGLVVVHTGLLAAAESPDEVAGVLAHEITHVLHRHSMRQLVFAAGLGGAVQLLVGSPEGAVGILSGAALDLTSLGYGRDQERDADRGGLDLLEKSRLPPEGLLHFFETLKAKGGTPPALLSSHPPSDDRRQDLEEEVRKRGAWAVEPLTVDWPAVRESVR